MTILQALLVATVAAESVLLLRTCRRDRPSFADRFGVPAAVAALLACGLFLITHGPTTNAVSMGDVLIGVAFGAAAYEALRR